jgi:TRAP-type C4-dicarboxylate transport system substrate-binding protein
MSYRGKTRIKALSAGLSVLGALALAGCAEDGGGAGSGGGEGLPAGATIEEYKAAFADIDPIKINTQSPSPKGSVTGRNVEEYLKAVTEWSDGKITFEVAYSNAIAPPTEVDNALVDGRLDLGQVLPIYEPAEYPATAAMIDAGFISNQSAVVGTLQSNAWPNEVAFNNEDILNEYDEHGMVPLVPVYNSGVNALFCSDERTDLDSLDGMESASGGTAQSKEIEALGGSAATVAYPELFESLQRGVVDCSVSSLTVGVLGGFIPSAPHVVIDPEAGFSLAPGSMAFSKTKWEELPLVAQQLFWDKLDVFVGVNIEDKIFPNTADAVKQAKENGGSVQTFGDDARASLQEVNASMLDDLRGTDATDGDALIDASTAAADKWLAKVQELGYTDEVGYNEFDTWFAPGKIDLTEYTKTVIDEIFAEHRPS